MKYSKETFGVYELDQVKVKEETLYAIFAHRGPDWDFSTKGWQIIGEPGTYKELKSLIELLGDFRRMSPKVEYKLIQLDTKLVTSARDFEIE